MLYNQNHPIASGDCALHPDCLRDLLLICPFSAGPTFIHPCAFV